jgi:hypothetical protein
VWGLLNQELKALCVNWDELTVGRCSHCRAARDLLYESQFSENGARLGVFHDDVADCNHRFHAAAVSALVPASHRRDAWLGCAPDGDDSFPLTDGGRLPADRMLRAAFTSRS